MIYVLCGVAGGAALWLVLFLIDMKIKAQQKAKMEKELSSFKDAFAKFVSDIGIPQKSAEEEEFSQRREVIKQTVFTATGHLSACRVQEKKELTPMRPQALLDEIAFRLRRIGVRDGLLEMCINPTADTIARLGLPQSMSQEVESEGTSAFLVLRKSAGLTVDSADRDKILMENPDAFIKPQAFIFSLPFKDLTLDGDVLEKHKGIDYSQNVTVEDLVAADQCRIFIDLEYRTQFELKEKIDLDAVETKLASGNPEAGGKSTPEKEK